MAVHMRMAPRTKAVESYLRNFERERERLQEVLEVTLCYGVFCLSQNFSLKGMTAEELRAVTKYEAIKKRDYFVRNAGITPRRSQSEALERSSSVNAHQQLRVKPSHSWRDGDDHTETHFRDDEDGRAETVAAAKQSSLENLATPAEKPFDAIDFFTQLFGKQFVDTAWTTYAGREGSQIVAESALAERFTRIDQRKVADKFPSLSLPVSSFVDFLSEYVKACVSRSASGGDAERIESEDGYDDAFFHHKENVNVNTARKARQRGTGGGADKHAPVKSALGGGGVRPRTGGVHPRATPKSSATEKSSQALRPRSFQHVESRIKPELDARRDKLLRVKKTQTQLMKESLARARLAEYEAKRMLDEASAGKSSGARFQRAKTMPLSEITTGAAALEIADGFMKSPLLDTFSRRGEDRSVHTHVNAARDPLREELYGAAALDDAFLGCSKPSPVSASRKPQPRKSTRGYNGWLGDFGPLHTKTVVPEWTPADDESDDESGQQPQQPARSQGEERIPFYGRASSKKFEWNFDGIGTETSKRGTVAGRKQSASGGSSIYNADEEDADRVSDDDYLSDDVRSEVSDPVFKWLKRAV